MDPAFCVELLRAAIFQAAMLVGPILAVAMIIGLGVSLFQAVTAIHEQTLTFVPKVVGISVALILLLPWMLQSMVQFTTSVIERIPQMTH
jgi:flagellar biosynthetic protein FliQ